MNKTDNQAITLQKELDNAKQSQQKLVRSFKFQIQQLSQLLIRLSKFYEGADKDIDKELQNLRSHLGGKANFALAEVSIQKLNSLLIENADYMRTQNTKTLNLLESSVKDLLNRDGLSTGIKTEVRSLLDELQKHQASIYTSLPYFEQALNIYQQALSNSVKRHRASDTSPVNSTDISVTDKLHKEISQELHELILQLASGPDTSPELNRIKLQLIKGINHEELLECCLIIIRTILKDVIKERKYAEQFVHGLHQSLTKMNESVSQTLVDAQSQYQLKIESNSSLREHVQDIGEAVDSAKDLKGLKQKAQGYLEKMTDTLDSREKIDQEEQKVLMGLLNDMHEQLTNLEQEAASYKNRLLEQKLNSHQDPLTRIPNRAAYNERLDIEYKRWRRYKSDLCMAVIDIDHFKNINDSYGHAAGDKTLQVIVKQISKCLRSTDFLARWGGEEFVLLFPQTSITALGKPLEAIRKKVESIPFKFKDKSVTITISAGATNFTDKDELDEVFERADQALYQAKDEGRNRFIISQG